MIWARSWICSHDSVLLKDDSGRRRRLPKTYIDEEDEGAKLAILSIDSQAVEEGGFSEG